MTASLSLYASKILKEHPLGLWPLQDKADYISILSNAQKNMTNWELTNGTIETTSTLSTPMQQDAVFKINTSNTGNANNVKTVTSVSPEFSDFNFLNDFLSTFTLSTFFYSSTERIMAVTIGFLYNDPTYGEYRVAKRFSTAVSGKWMFLSETFDRPYNLDSSFNLFVEVEFLSDATTDPVFFLANGISLGQWSEEFNSSSSGVHPETIIENIYGIASGTQAVKLLAVAESTKDGYAICLNNRLLGRNAGIPMVYGAGSSMSVSPNTSGKPSILIPGLGFLNQLGKNKNYTLESWIKIDPSSENDQKIIGPIASLDGLYVSGPFLKLKIGDRSCSHYVSEWNRPMLVHVSISHDRIALLVNGEQVGEIIVDRSTLTLPEEKSGNLEQDWIGIYSYDSIDLFEVGPVSIYTYPISPIIAKRRWVYGQGVENPETLNVAYGGKNISVDYQFSKYSSNYSYPKIGSWSKGIKNNLLSDTDYLRIPNYSSISIVSPTQTQAEILQNNLALQNESSKFVVLPQNSYMYLESINILPDDLSSFYGVFKSTATPQAPQTLFELREKLSGDNLSIKLTSSGITYTLSFSGTTETFAETLSYFPGEQFAVGLDIERLSKYFGNRVSSFFSKKSSLSLYIGGTSENDTFVGKIYSVSFSNQKASESLSDYFAPNGLVWDAELVDSLLDDADGGLYSTTFWQMIYDGGNVAEHAGAGLINNTKASYTIKPYSNSSTMYFDGSMNGSWASAIPLSYFGQYVKTASGDTNYDLDFIQFNIGYPSPGKSVAVLETDTEWTYQDLSSKFSIPSQKKYSDLDNHLYTGYTDYSDLMYNAKQTYKYDTSKSLIKTYVYFKDISEESDYSSAYYTNIVEAPRDGMILPGSEWINTKYEVVDNVIIYPPSGIDFKNTNMFTEIVVSVDKISDKPLAIGSLELSSVVLNNEQPTAIGTRYGTDMYPFTENGFYYDYKSKNPFSIYKGSTPYLYLTKTSGIRLRGLFNGKNSRGIEIPVNKEKVATYKMIAMQFFAMFDDDFFPYSPMEVFEIVSNDTHLKFYIEATHPEGIRAKLYAINVKTGQVENGIGYYINGNIVKDPVLTIKQWAAIGIGFSNYLDFSLNGGSIRITGPLTINNLSHYNSSRIQQVQSISVRPWFGVRESGRVKYDWEYWDGIFKWYEVLVLSTRNFYGVDPSDIYKAYVGTTRLVVDDKSILRLFRTKYRVISNSSTNLFTINSV